MTWRAYATAAIGIGLVSAVITATTAGQAVAQGVKAVQAIIVNTSDDPVPVEIVGSAPVNPPVWQGTPLAARDVVINTNTTGFEYCEETVAAPANAAILLHTVSGFMSAPPGGEALPFFRITNLDGSTMDVVLPMARTGTSRSGIGVLDAYTGSLQLGGFPVAGIASCVAGVHAVGAYSYIGFTVPLP